MAITLGPLGPSLGYLLGYFKWKDIRDCENVIRRSGSTAAEFVWTADRADALLEPSQSRDFVEYLSLHLTPTEPAEHQQLQDCQALHKFDVALLHPDTFSAAEVETLRRKLTNLSIENMDRDKKYGQTLAHIQELGERHPDCTFVLDAQHAFEVSIDAGGDGIDLTISLAKYMLRDGRLAHIHASGEVSENGHQTVKHAQLHLATNSKQILCALREILSLPGHKPIPVIFEGNYFPDNATDQEVETPQRHKIVRAASNRIKRERQFFLENIKL